LREKGAQSLLVHSITVPVAKLNQLNRTRVGYHRGLLLSHIVGSLQTIHV